MNLLNKISKVLLLMYCFAVGTIGMAQSNQYLHFDGEDDYAMLAEAAQYVGGSNKMSMTGWFYTDELIYGAGMMGFRGGGSGDGAMYLIQLSDGFIECRLITASGLREVKAPAGTIKAKTWQHIAWVYDVNRIKLYVDGVSIGSTFASGMFNSDDKPFGIGKNILPGFNFIFKGRIDEVTLWSKGLSEEEINDMIANELNGDEEGLELYYKFDQGIPGADNSSISALICEVGDGERDASLENFAMNGVSSNFGGTLSAELQVISFPLVDDKLITDNPFELEAYSSSELPVSYEVISGPATVVGNTVTLDGTAGEVVIEASQEGNATVDPAEEVTINFHVLDPNMVFPSMELTNPTAGDMVVSNLGPIQLAVVASIDYPSLFSVSDITININGDEVVMKDYDNGYYTGWWTPNAYGTYTVEVTGRNNFDAALKENYTINIVEQAENQLVKATEDVHLYAENYSEIVEVELPNFMGSYDQIIGTLDIKCPSGGCDPWDRVSHIEVQGHDGEWREIIRFITSYGKACTHVIDLTDFMSTLQGKVKFRLTLGTSGNGFLYNLDLDYRAGVPAYKYSTISTLWNGTYSFGDYANLQPCETFEIDYNENVEASTLKLVSTGHGWGDANTGNAAEFHRDKHHIHIDGASTFEQDNWVDCFPNPDDCNDQFGTYKFDRAGWCPGAIAQWFDYNMTSYIPADGEPLEMKYIFNENYVDRCHPNHPDCISGVTCTNCNEGFNPHLIVSSHLVSFSNQPIGDTKAWTGIEDTDAATIDFSLYPNPTTGKFDIDLGQNKGKSKISIYDNLGKLVKEIQSANKAIVAIDLSNEIKGIYYIKIETAAGSGAKKVMVN